MKENIINSKNNNNRNWESIRDPWTTETAKVMVAETEASNISKPKKRKRRKILWKRVIGAPLLLIAIVFTGIKAIDALSGIRPHSDSSSSKGDTSAVVIIDNDSTSSKDDASSIHEHPVLVTLTEDEFSTLVLAVEHECGTNPLNYMSLAERQKYQSLKKLSAPTQDEQQKIFAFEEKANTRYDKAEQLCAAMILNRVGKKGFGANPSMEVGAKDLMDVLSQPGQYSQVDPETGEVVWSLLDNIARYWERGLDPCDSRTIANVKAVVYGEVTFDSNLVYEIAHTVRTEYFQEIDPEEAAEAAEQDLLARNSYSEYVHSYEQIPCSYQETDPKTGISYWIDVIQVFGTNETGSGYADMLV